jgi:hypothetical protein
MRYPDEDEEYAPIPETYTRTPNTMVPLNSRQQGEIASIAMEQLRTYQRTANHWPMFEVRRDGRDCMCCQKCNESLWFVTDREEQRYVYTEAELLTLKVAHIRQAHDDDGTNNGRRQD